MLVSDCQCTHDVVVWVWMIRHRMKSRMLEAIVSALVRLVTRLMWLYGRLIQRLAALSDACC